MRCHGSSRLVTARHGSSLSRLVTARRCHGSSRRVTATAARARLTGPPTDSLAQRPAGRGAASRPRLSFAKRSPQTLRPSTNSTSIPAAVAVTSRDERWRAPRAAGMGGRRRDERSSIRGLGSGAVTLCESHLGQQERAANASSSVFMFSSMKKIRLLSLNCRTCPQPCDRRVRAIAAALHCRRGPGIARGRRGRGGFRGGGSPWARAAATPPATRCCPCQTAATRPASRRRAARAPARSCAR